MGLNFDLKFTKIPEISTNENDIKVTRLQTKQSEEIFKFFFSLGIIITSDERKTTLTKVFEMLT